MIFESGTPKTRPHEQVIQTIDYVAFSPFLHLISHFISEKSRSSKWHSCTVRAHSFARHVTVDIWPENHLLRLEFYHLHNVECTMPHKFIVFSPCGFTICDTNQFNVQSYRFISFRFHTLCVPTAQQIFVFALPASLSLARLRATFVAVNFHAICTIRCSVLTKS